MLTAERQQQEKNFLKAAKNGNLYQMKNYINNGVDKEAKDDDGWTALHFASSKGRLEVVKYLIETCHVNKDARDNDGQTALYYASYNKKVHIVRYFIKTCRPDQEAKDDVFERAVLRHACTWGWLGDVKYLIETCHVNAEARDNDKWNALHNASSNGQLDIVVYLVETCSVDTEITSKNETAYDIARRYNRRDVANYLKMNASTTTKNQTNGTAGKIIANSDTFTVFSSDTASMELEGKNSSPTANLDTTGSTDILIQNASYKPKSAQKQNDPEQKVEFMEAARKGSLEKMKECISNGIDVEATINDGITVLHMASSNGHLDIVRYLVQDCGINVEMKTNIGRTALHDACSNNNLDIVKYLIQTGQVDVEAKDNNGWAALHFASRYGCLDIVPFLIQQCHVNMDVENNEGEVAYDVARKDEIKEYLSQARADIQASTDELEKQQHSASVEKSKQAVKEQLPITVNPDILLDTDKMNAKSGHSEASLVKYDLDEEWVSELMASLQSELQSFVDKLSQLGDSHHYIDGRRDILDLVLVEKCNTIEEQNEQISILASPLHRDFYLLLQRKLKCMIKSCEALSTGMVGVGGGDMRSFAARTIRENGCNVLRETKLGYFIGNAVQWAQRNLAVVPFIDTVGSVFQLIVTLNEERDRYLGLARVADFATMVCLQQNGTTSLDNAVEKLARWIVRARCGAPSCKFVEESDEFGKYKQLMINLLADSGDTPAKEQASIAADCAFAHIMKPEKGSILFDVLYGGTFDVGLDEALAASILGVTLEDLRELDSFTMTSQGAIPSNADTNNRSRQVTANTQDFGLNGPSFHADSFASSELFAEHEAKIQKQDETIQLLSRQFTLLLEEKLKQSKSKTDFDAGDGLVFANPAEQFKNDIARLQTDNVGQDQRLRDQATIIDKNESRIAELEKRLGKLQREIDIKRGTKTGRRVLYSI